METFDFPIGNLIGILDIFQEFLSGNTYNKGNSQHVQNWVRFHRCCSDGSFVVTGVSEKTTKFVLVQASVKLTSLTLNLRIVLSNIKDLNQ